MVRDPKLLKKLTVKEFDSFPDHQTVIPEEADSFFNRVLFSLKGQKWRGVYLERVILIGI
jgi:cytochrome P450 family 9